jgi:hypothetical protein
VRGRRQLMGRLYTSRMIASSLQEDREESIPVLDVISLPPFAHLSDHEGLGSCLCMAFTPLLKVAGTAGHGPG